MAGTLSTFKGIIDEVALYNRPVSATEVQSIYSAGSAGLCAAAPYFTTPAALPDAVIGQTYSQTFALVGGTEPYTFNTSDTLPAGLSLSGGGAIVGTPTVSGSFTLTVLATDAAHKTATRTFSLRVRNFTGASYTWLNDGNSTVGNWSDSSHWTPNGVPGPSDEAIINGGQVVVDGNPTVAVLNFLLNPSRENNLRGPGQLTVATQMNWTGGRILNGLTLNIAGNATLNISGSEPKTFDAPSVINNAGTINWTGNGNIVGYNDVIINNLPTGRLEIQSDAVLSPQGSGQVINNSGIVRKSVTSGATTCGFRFNNTDTGTLDVQSGTFLCYGASPALNNSGALTIGNASVVVNGNYSPAASASLNVVLSGIAPVSQFGQLKVLGNAALNGALNISFGNGFVPTVGNEFLVVSSGTRSGSFTSTSGLGLGAGLSLSLNYPAVPPGALLTAVMLGVSPASLPNGYMGRPYAQSFAGINGVGPYAFSLTGGLLPPNVSLSANGLVSGTPSISGQFDFTVRVTDQGATGAPSVETNCSLRVFVCGLTDGSCLYVPEFVTLGALPDSRVGLPYWHSLSVLFGHPGYTFAVTSGSLPAGLTLSAAGLIKGTPLSAGGSTFTVVVTDALGNSSQGNFTLNVNPQPACVTIDGAWARWPGESSTDETINGFNAALFNGVSFTPGVVGQAFLFDGVDDYFQASVPYIPSSQSGSTDKNCSLELWMRMDAPASGRAWVAGYGDPGDLFNISHPAFGIYVGPDQKLAIFGTAAQGPAVEVGRWYHVVAIYDDGVARLYVDGALASSVAQPGFPGQNGPVYLGQYPPGVGSTRSDKLLFRGAVDEPTLFTRALSAAEVRSIYDAGGSGKCRSLNNTVPNATCEVIAQTMAANQLRVRGLAFGPDNEPVATWTDDRGIMWIAHANGSWGVPHQVKAQGINGLVNVSQHGFALRADGHPFFIYGVDNIYIGNESYRHGLYVVDGGLQPEGPGSFLYYPNFCAGDGGVAAVAFSPGASNPEWMYWSDCGFGFAYDFIRQPSFAQAPNSGGYDFVINANGVPALYGNYGGSIRMSRTLGVVDGPPIVDGSQLAGTVANDNVFHALISGVVPAGGAGNGKMVYATSLNGTNWVFTDLGPGVDFVKSRAVGIAVNPSGKPALAYFRAGKLWYAELINGHWAQTAVGAYSGYEESFAPHLRQEIFRLAFDREGKPAIAIFDPGTANLLLCRPAGLRHPPVAIPQNLTTPEDTPLALRLNGTDPDGDALTITVMSAPAHGALTGTLPVLTYTPAQDFFGADSFTFKVDDGQEGTSTATISITVTPVNDPPVADPQNLTTPEDTALPLILTAGDVDDEFLTISAFGPPSHGTLTGAAPNLTYSPALNYNGPDSFTFTVVDGSNATSTATISITVTAVNDAPVANAQSVTTPEDIAKAITLTGSDVDGDTLAFTVATSPTHGALSGTAPNLTYTPAPNYNGPDSLTFRVSDPSNATSTATISITVTPVNDPPVANADSVTVLEGSGANFVDVLANDNSGPDFGETLTVVAVAAPSVGTATFTAGGISYTPGPGFQSLGEGETGSDSFAYTISDGNGGTADAIVSVMVIGVNNAPVAAADNVSTDENTSLILSAATLLANDSDPDAHDTLVIASLDSTGTLGTVAHNPDGSITYVPAASFQSLGVGETASDSFAYAISDGHGGTATARVNVTITGVNDDPVAVADSATVAEDSVNNSIDVLANDTDVDTTDLRTVTAISSPAHGNAAFTAGGVTYTPASNYFGPDTFTYTLSDNHGGSAVGTVNITVTPVNDSPVARDGTVTTPEDTSVQVTLGATDVEGDSLTYSIVTAPVHGSLSVVTGDKVTYTPAPNYNGPDSFKFKARDGSDDSNAATVSVTVNPVDDTPVLANPGDRTNYIGEAISLQLVATDPENDPLTYSAVGLPRGLNINPQSGLISDTVQGTSNKIYQVTVAASDGYLTDSKNFTWTILNPNHPPVANNGIVSTTQNTPTEVTLVASDADGDALIYTILTGPSHGSLGPVTGNKVVYTSVASYSGPDSFVFQVTDGHGGIASATISIAVAGPPPTSPGAKVTGGGTINGRGGKANYGFEVLVTGNGRLQGNLTYHDPGANEDVKATSITALSVSTDCKHGTVYGVATINGQGAFNFVADMDDFAEPGANVDTFRIQLSDGYVADGIVTTGGNIQVHCKK